MRSRDSPYVSAWCPTGYEELTGDIPGWGDPGLGTYDNWDRNFCAGQCNFKEQCLSFEHSDNSQQCNLNTAGEPTASPYLDFVFCKKMSGIGNINY